MNNKLDQSYGFAGAALKMHLKTIWTPGGLPWRCAGTIHHQSNIMIEHSRAVLTFARMLDAVWTILKYQNTANTLWSIATIPTLPLVNALKMTLSTVSLLVSNVFLKLYSFILWNYLVCEGVRCTVYLLRMSGSCLSTSSVFYCK